MSRGDAVPAVVRVEQVLGDRMLDLLWDAWPALPVGSG